MVLLISVLRSLFSLYSLALVGRVFLEMILGPYHSAVVFLRRITEPVPIVAIVLLWVIERVLILILGSFV